jgi:hypothetical protein
VTKALVPLALAVALGAGIALPLLWDDPGAPSSPRIPIDSVEQRLLTGYTPAHYQRPESVNCRPAGRRYACTLYYVKKDKATGIAERFAFDIEVPAYPDR